MNDSPRTLEIFSKYFFSFVIFSFFLKKVLPYHTKPITNKKSHRFLGVIPVREIVLITPVSFFVWIYFSKKYIKNINNQKILAKELGNSVVAMFITGFFIHKSIGVKSRLGYCLGITEDADGTGFAPYSGY